MPHEMKVTQIENKATQAETKTDPGKVLVTNPAGITNMIIAIPIEWEEGHKHYPTLQEIVLPSADKNKENDSKENKPAISKDVFREKHHATLLTFALTGKEFDKEQIENGSLKKLSGQLGLFKRILKTDEKNKKNMLAARQFTFTIKETKLWVKDGTGFPKVDFSCKELVSFRQALMGNEEAFCDGYRVNGKLPFNPHLSLTVKGVPLTKEQVANFESAANELVGKTWTQTVEPYIEVTYIKRGVELAKAKKEDISYSHPTTLEDVIAIIAEKTGKQPEEIAKLVPADETLAQEKRQFVSQVSQTMYSPKKGNTAPVQTESKQQAEGQKTLSMSKAT